VPNVEVLGISEDSRTIKTGDLFVARPGTKTDGAKFVADAHARGAVAVITTKRFDNLPLPQIVLPDLAAASILANAYHGHPSHSFRVIGVTGTNGKTTTTYLLRSILEADGRATGLVGTVEWLVGGATRDAPHTTPEAIDLQRLFREMLDAGDEAAAIEASSHGSHYRRLDRVRFGALAFTNLGQEHLDLHGDMEEYFRAKRRLFTGLTPPPAAINVGDPYGRRLAEELAGAHRAPLVTFGLRPEAEVRADGLEVGPKGSSFTAVGIDVETPLLGIFNVENVLAAIAAATLLDVEDEAIVEGIRAVGGVPGRFEAIDEGQDFAVVVDYAHKPDALAAALQASRQLGNGRLTVVFGAGGDRDRTKRAEMGRLAKELADRVILTNDNPRSEEPLAIVEQILQGTGLDVEVDLDRRSAIETAIEGAEAGDVVLIAGKGHEQGQEIGDEVNPFDDRDVARTALRRHLGVAS